MRCLAPLVVVSGERGIQHTAALAVEMAMAMGQNVIKDHWCTLKR